MSREELRELDRLGILDGDTVVVHGLALDHQGVALMRERGASVIVCPSSNKFLFERLPDITRLSEIELIAIGNDSPLTAEGDLLDEVRFAIGSCGVSPSAAYDMVTTAPAAILRLQDGEGAIQQSGVADLIAVRDTGEDPADRMRTLSMSDIELVIIGGRVQLASETILKRLPFSAKQGLEAIAVDARIRWLRAPVRTLLREAEEVLGSGEVYLGGRRLCIPQAAEALHAC
jgi:cytosine/adenosine deaminase-related metal-dependent hydrolase